VKHWRVADVLRSSPQKKEAEEEAETEKEGIG
jgi:hypothetical protein